jgi:excinuclease ABC subunit A
VILIEHNLDVIKSADWIIDLGPEGGDAGGHIVATGTPAALARQAASHTGQALTHHVPEFGGRRPGSKAGQAAGKRRAARAKHGKKSADAAD